MEKKINFRLRRIIAALVALAGVGVWLVINPESYEATPTDNQVVDSAESERTTGSAGVAEEAGSAESADSTGSADGANEVSALEILAKLKIKGRAPKTGYNRKEFYSRWPDVDGCSLRQIIIKREVGESAKLNGCDVVEGSFIEPYTGELFSAKTKSDFSSGIQIDHIVALSDAWQKGAQYKTKEERYNLATDPLNLIAVDSKANQQKSDGDAATWLPKNKAFRCQYVARQVSVKYKYGLWVSQAEHDAISKILGTCPNEKAVGV